MVVVSHVITANLPVHVQPSEAFLNLSLSGPIQISQSGKRAGNCNIPISCIIKVSSIQCVDVWEPQTCMAFIIIFH